MRKSQEKGPPGRCLLPSGGLPWAPGSSPDWALAHYLFKCSSRKRKVMRLGSGRVRSRCIMQFSLAAGSDRAGGRAGEAGGRLPGGQAQASAPMVRRLWDPEGEPGLPCAPEGSRPIGKEGPGISQGWAVNSWSLQRPPPMTVR